MLSTFVVWMQGFMRAVTSVWAALNMALRVAFLLLLVLLQQTITLEASATSISLPYVFSAGTTAVSQQVNANFTAITNVVNGSLSDNNVQTAAGIQLSKININAPALSDQASGAQSWSSGITGDTQPRIGFTSDGLLQGGAGGSSTPDVTLKRSAVNTWQISSGATIDMNGGGFTNVASGTVPSGTIVAWYGTGSVPTGWLLCNGTSGTPNLIGMFIQGGDITGGSSTANPNGFGSTANQSQVGVTSHVHSVTVTGSGNTGNPSNVSTVQSGTGQNAASNLHTHSFSVISSGTSGAATNQPSAYVLVYIMKQ